MERLFFKEFSFSTRHLGESPHQHLVLSVSLLNCSHVSGYEMVTLCGFNLHFLDDNWCGLLIIPMSSFVK